ncbi:MAG: hypothetical protein KBT03_09345 [Bacteroidales bacterium]|nr:hypothetical protein [Candidatus Scybalousia scybalohippi]
MKETFKIAGMKYRIDNLKKIAIPNERYNLSKNDLKKLGVDLVYEYKFDIKSVELIPEPDNPHDNNAVKVIFNGVHIGYIKRGSCSRVKNLLRDGYEFKLDYIKYGNSKEIVEYEEGETELQKDYDEPRAAIYIEKEDNNTTKEDTKPQKQKEKLSLPLTIACIVAFILAFLSIIGVI